MRILYLHQYFKTPEDGEAMRSFYIATAMVKAGHEVVMVTSHNKKDFEQKEVCGIQVNYLPVSYFNEYSFAKRIKAFLKFQKLSVRLVKNLGKFDICYATSTPLTVGWAAVKLKKQMGIPYVFEARDLWPDAPLAFGAIRSKIVANSLKKMEKAIYAGAYHIVALNPIVKKIVEERTNTPVSFVPNMADVSYFSPLYRQNDTPFFLYAGTIGAANDVGQVIDLAEKIPNGKFLIAGEGKGLMALKAKVEALGLNNILFLGRVNKGELKRLYEKADFALITFKDNPILELNSPNKFFDALANGVVPIVTVKGWLKDLVTEYQCGIYLSPASQKEEVHALMELFNDKEKLLQMKQNSRKVAEKEFSVEELTQQILNIMA